MKMQIFYEEGDLKLKEQHIYLMKNNFISK